MTTSAFRALAIGSQVMLGGNILPISNAYYTIEDKKPLYHVSIGHADPDNPLLQPFTITERDASLIQPMPTATHKAFRVDDVMYDKHAVYA